MTRRRQRKCLSTAGSSSHKRVVVIDDRRHVVGIVADSDLISTVSHETWPGLMEFSCPKFRSKESADIRASTFRGFARGQLKELMTRGVITVREEMPVASALTLSAEKRVKRLPVVDADGELVGIVAQRR